MIPSDVAALRALVEAGRKLYRAKGHTMACRFSGCTCGAVAEHADAMSEWGRLLFAAQEALAKERGCSECWTGTSCGADCRMSDVVEARDA